MGTRPTQKTKKESVSCSSKSERKKFKEEVINSNGIPDTYFVFYVFGVMGSFLSLFFFLTKKMLHCSEKVTWEKKSTVFEDLKYLI